MPKYLDTNLMQILDLSLPPEDAPAHLMILTPKHLPPVVLPDCPLMFLKKSGDGVIEMTQAEKDALVDSRKRYKTREQIFKEVRVNSPADFDLLLDAIDKFPSFSFCLELGDVPTALTRLAKAKSNGLTTAQHDRIKAICETKI